MGCNTPDEDDVAEAGTEVESDGNGEENEDELLKDEGDEDEEDEDEDEEYYDEFDNGGKGGCGAITPAPVLISVSAPVPISPVGMVCAGC
ncbi:hypothetical protein FACS1894152_5870 [Bacilli bacterium]|nr:hypothetical protein FACS1894152_5870 [Bacilli bacterium]